MGIEDQKIGRQGYYRGLCWGGVVPEGGLSDSESALLRNTVITTVG